MSMECEKEKGLLEYVRKASPPPFLLKTYMMVDDPETDDVISWNSDGMAFVVWQPAEFARDLLPTLFKHSNFSSFVRQLNTYGFRKVATSRWEFGNEMFRRGERDKLCDIQRRKACSNQSRTNEKAQAEHKDHSEDEDQRSSSSTSSSSDFTTLVDENRRLRLENGVLNSELALVKKKCKELLELASIHGGNSEREESVGEGKSIEGPKIFGVRLGAEGGMEKNRNRAEIGESVRLINLSHSCK